MSELTRNGVGTPKAVFTLHAIDAADRPALHTNQWRAVVNSALQVAPHDAEFWEIIGEALERVE